MYQRAAADRVSCTGRQRKQNPDQRAAHDKKHNIRNGNPFHRWDMKQTEQKRWKQYGGGSVPSVFQKPHNKPAKQHFFQDSGLQSCQGRRRQQQKRFPGREPVHRYPSHGNVDTENKGRKKNGRSHAPYIQPEADSELFQPPVKPSNRIQTKQKKGKDQTARHSEKTVPGAARQLYYRKKQVEDQAAKQVSCQKQKKIDSHMSDRFSC